MIICGPFCCTNRFFFSYRREGGRKGRGKEGTTKEEGEMAKEILLNIFCRQSVLKVDMDRRFVKLWGICARLPANAWE